MSQVAPGNPSLWGRDSNHTMVSMPEWLAALRLLPLIFLGHPTSQEKSAASASHSQFRQSVGAALSPWRPSSGHSSWGVLPLPFHHFPPLPHVFSPPTIPTDCLRQNSKRFKVQLIGLRGYQTPHLGYTLLVALG